jgi:hypothetical protein
MNSILKKLDPLTSGGPDGKSSKMLIMVADTILMSHFANFLGRPKFVRTKHDVRYHSAHLYLVGFKFDHQNVYNVITTCMLSSIIRRNLGHMALKLSIPLVNCHK